jgi:nucleotide-binding universal stress UspA family protein
MPTPTILIPLDGSKLAEASLFYLPILAPLGSFDVELIHVVDPEAARDARAAAWHPGPYLEETAAGLANRTGMQVKSLSPKATPYAAILAEAENPWISMIITTTHGLSGFQRWRMGSVADKVIRGAPCPTFVIGPSARGAPPAFTRILVPLDGSQLAEEALPVAKALAEKLNANIRLLRAVSPRTVPDELAGTLTADVIDSYELMAGEYLDETRLELETSQAVETAAVTGPAADVILSQAAEPACDLVVMTSHGRGGFVRFAIGSVTERVLGASPAPVLVVRPGQWERFAQLAGCA